MTMHRNSLSTQTELERLVQYNKDIIHDAVAYCSDGSVVPLKNKKCTEVEFISGLWRVQNVEQLNMINVRGRLFVLGDKLNRQENNHFEFYKAYLVGENCYGYFTGDKSDYIIAKYETKDGIYWGYGKTLENARAFLGVRLYDTYQELLHQQIGKKTNTK